MNDADCVTIAERPATTALGAAHVDAHAEPIMASEDFGVLASHIPGCLVFLGNGTEPDASGVPLHSHDYRCNDTILETGVAFYTAVVRDVLS